METHKQIKAILMKAQNTNLG